MLSGRRVLVSSRSFSSKSFFPSVEKIQYEGPESKNPLAFREYNADEVIFKKPMREWLRFSVCYWHSFCATGLDPFGTGTMTRPWLKSNDPIQQAKDKADAAFEFFTKLGVDYYTFHDRDIAPEGHSFDESVANLTLMKDYLKAKQEETGVKLLWGTANLFSHPRFMNGGGTNPDLNVFAHAATQIRHAMDVTYELGGENYVFWGGREGFQSILNTNIKQELDQFAQLLKMAVEYRNSIGGKFQFLIEPKPREPTKHQYDYDAMTVYAFLQHYGLEKDFKMNIEPNHTTLAGHEYEHDIIMSAIHGVLGSIDCNTGDTLVGWDTDQFLMDSRKATLVMKTILSQPNGLSPGGLNFDAKVRRESTNLEDMFIAHIGSMDCFAKGLRTAAAMLESGEMEDLVTKRYSSWESAMGKRVLSGQASLQDLEAFAKENGEPTQASGQQELYEMVFNRY